MRAFGVGEWADWYRVCEAREEISITRPFYPMRPGNSSPQHLIEALQVELMNDLLRACDRATPDRRAACSIFWTLGGNQVGKAAIAGWRELIVPHLDDIGLWPFGGSLHELLVQHDLVVVETYPGDVYRQVGIPKALRWSKTAVDGRLAALPYVRSWLEVEARSDKRRLGCRASGRVRRRRPLRFLYRPVRHAGRGRRCSLRGQAAE